MPIRLNIITPNISEPYLHYDSCRARLRGYNVYRYLQRNVTRVRAALNGDAGTLYDLVMVVIPNDGRLSPAQLHTVHQLRQRNIPVIIDIDSGLPLDEYDVAILDVYSPTAKPLAPAVTIPSIVDDAWTGRQQWSGWQSRTVALVASEPLSAPPPSSDLDTLLMCPDGDLWPANEGDLRALLRMRGAIVLGQRDAWTEAMLRTCHHAGIPAVRVSHSRMLPLAMQMFAMDSELDRLVRMIQFRVRWHDPTVLIRQYMHLFHIVLEQHRKEQ